MTENIEKSMTLNAQTYFLSFRETIRQHMTAEKSNSSNKIDLETSIYSMGSHLVLLLQQ